jgi:hypothetical protein
MIHCGRDSLCEHKSHFPGGEPFGAAFEDLHLGVNLVNSLLEF